jgi:hypothetical protein
MTNGEDGSVKGLDLTSPGAKRSLGQVYLLLLRLAEESAPAESDGTEAGADGDRDHIDRQPYDNPSGDQEQMSCA